MFEQATRLRIRFLKPTGGTALVEDLWHLPLKYLNSMAKEVNAQLKLSVEQSFLEETPVEDKELTLKLDLLKHIIKVRQAEQKAEVTKRENKEKKQYILSIIHAKKEQKLQDMDLSDLEKMVQDL